MIVYTQQLSINQCNFGRVCEALSPVVVRERITWCLPATPHCTAGYGDDAGQESPQRLLCSDCTSIRVHPMYIKEF